jgi:glycosyltransferase involved in cell wall biosynthesis
MKTSVLIIAHNEAAHIAWCIESVLNQTKKADEIVLIVHNSTDATETIARTYPLTVIPYTGPSGITYARIEGLQQVQGDIILCIDGDAYASPNWIEEMTHILTQGNVLVGSWVRFKGTVHGWISNILNKYNCIHRKKVERWIWGSSMAFWGKDKDVVKEIFEKSIVLSRELNLTRNPHDYWLALFMQKRGKLAVTNNTSVTSIMKEVTSAESIKRNSENISNGNKMERYFKEYYR